MPDLPPRIMDLAADEARELNHNSVGTRHLLLALTRHDSGVADVLRELGITVEGVRARIEPGAPSQGPPGVPPFTPRAKKVLELSLRESLQLGHNYIAGEHILLGVIREGHGTAIAILADLAVDPADLREHLIARLAEKGPRPQLEAERAHPNCPHCHAPLAQEARVQRLEVDEGSEARQTFAVVYCNRCGRSLAFKPIT